MSEIRREENGSKGRYVIEGPNGEVAEITYSRTSPALIIIDHTEVPDAFRGQGVGARLVAQAVEDARTAGAKIIPLCPFAAAQFRRHAGDWADVLSQ